MNYEQKYKEALEKARQFSEHPLQEDSSSIVEYIFPELKESEDEKIRKALIRFHKSTINYLKQSSALREEIIEPNFQSTEEQNRDRQEREYLDRLTATP